MPTTDFALASEQSDFTIKATATTYPPDGSVTTIDETILNLIDKKVGANYTLDKGQLEFLLTLPNDITLFVNAWLIIKPTTITNPEARTLYVMWFNAGVRQGNPYLSFQGTNAGSFLVSTLTNGADNVLLLSDVTGSNGGMSNVAPNISVGIGIYIAGGAIPTGVNELLLTDFGNASAPRLRLQYSQVQKPVILQPANGAYDYTAAIQYLWQYTESNGIPQSRIDFVYRVNGGAELTHTVFTANQNWLGILPSLAHGSIALKIKLYDADGLPSQLSDQVTFVLGNPSPTPTIIAPTNASVVSVVRPVVQITSSDATRTAWRIRVLNSLGITLWNSGEIAGQGTSQEIGENLLNNSAYSIKAQTKNADAVWSAEASVNITTNFVLPPASTLNVSAQAGYIHLQPTTPAPSGGQPAIAYLDIYKRAEDEIVFRRVATGLPVGEAWDDAHTAVGVLYTYYADTVGVNTAITTGAQFSAEITPVLWGEVSRVHFVLDPMATMLALPMYEPDSDDNWSTDAEQVEYLGRSKAQTIRGRIEKESVTFHFMMPADENQWAAYTRLLRKLGSFCVRTPQGDIYIGDIPSRKRKRDLISGNDIVTLQLNCNSWVEDV